LAQKVILQHNLPNRSINTCNLIPERDLSHLNRTRRI
jgi:hypothetical protein